MLAREVLRSWIWNWTPWKLIMWTCSANLVDVVIFVCEHKLKVPSPIRTWLFRRGFSNIKITTIVKNKLKYILRLTRVGEKTLPISEMTNNDLGGLSGGPWYSWRNTILLSLANSIIFVFLSNVPHPYDICIIILCNLSSGCFISSRYQSCWRTEQYANSVLWSGDFRCTMAHKSTIHL